MVAIHIQFLDKGRSFGPQVGTRFSGFRFFWASRVQVVGCRVSGFRV